MFFQVSSTQSQSQTVWHTNPQQPQQWNWQQPQQWSHNVHQHHAWQAQQHGYQPSWHSPQQRPIQQNYYQRPTVPPQHQTSERIYYHDQQQRFQQLDQIRNSNYSSHSHLPVNVSVEKLHAISHENTSVVPISDNDKPVEFESQEKGNVLHNDLPNNGLETPLLKMVPPKSHEMNDQKKIGIYSNKDKHIETKEENFELKERYKLSKSEERSKLNDEDKNEVEIKIKASIPDIINTHQKANVVATSSPSYCSEPSARKVKQAVTNHMNVGDKGFESDCSVEETIHIENDRRTKGKNSELKERETNRETVICCRSLPFFRKESTVATERSVAGSSSLVCENENKNDSVSLTKKMKDEKEPPTTCWKTLPFLSKWGNMERKTSAENPDAAVIERENITASVSLTEQNAMADKNGRILTFWRSLPFVGKCSNSKREPPLAESHRPIGEKDEDKQTVSSVEENGIGKETERTSRKRCMSWNIIKQTVAIVLIILDVILDWVEYAEMSGEGEWSTSSDKSNVSCSSRGDHVAELFLVCTILGTLFAIVQVVNLAYQIFNETRKGKEGKKLMDGRTEVVITRLMEEIPQVLLIIAFRSECSIECNSDKSYKDVKSAVSATFSICNSIWRHLTSLDGCTFKREEKDEKSGCCKKCNCQMILWRWFSCCCPCIACFCNCTIPFYPCGKVLKNNECEFSCNNWGCESDFALCVTRCYPRHLDPPQTEYIEFCPKRPDGLNELTKILTKPLSIVHIVLYAIYMINVFCILDSWLGLDSLTDILF